jgi:hypothetical protein
MKKDVIERLDDVLDTLSNITFINQGGCGISALSIYRWLGKNELLKGDEHFVYFYTTDDNTYETNEKYLKNDSDYISSASHIGIYIDGNVYDCNGLIKSNRYTKKHTNIKEDVLIKSINNIECWNDMFYREKNIPYIEKKLKISLNDIKHEYSN